ncbi:MAG: hypothetical protein HZB65_01525 [Candidatus Aenigmarchaeota archaeon]|nr:hypothetical protein [Candidatus Aenigmarchaeota archaeon]
MRYVIREDVAGIMQEYDVSEQGFVPEPKESKLVKDAENGSGFALLTANLLKLKALQEYISKESKVAYYLIAFSAYAKLLMETRARRAEITKNNINEHALPTATASLNTYSSERILTAYYNSDNEFLIKYFLELEELQ